MSYQIYPVTPTKEICDSYRIRVNGKEVTPDTARVSAIPMNRRWPGHQRSLDQSELINFLSLETDEALEIELIPRTPADSVVIRPLGSVKNAEVESGIIRFTLPGAGYYSVEPFGRNNAFLIFADSPEKDRPDPNDPNVLYFGPGEHRPGMIHLKDNQTLFIDKGAVVYACVRAKKVNNIRITGRGILDNSENKEKILFEANAQGNHAAILNAERLHTIQPEFCQNVRIDSITIRDSLVYNIRPVGCTDFTVEDVKIIGNWRYNSDGIDMHNCTNVWISNCFIRTFDDCICVKGFDPWQNPEDMHFLGGNYDNFRHVRVNNCVLWNDWGKCLEIGAECQAEEICDVVFENCTAIHVMGPVLDCMNVDYADVHDVIYRNITVEYDDVIPKSTYQETDDQEFNYGATEYSPSLIQVEVCFHHEYSADASRRGKVRDFLFENISLIGRQPPKLRFRGHAEDAATENITVRNLTKNGKKVLNDPDLILATNEFCRNIVIE